MAVSLSDKTAAGDMALPSTFRKLVVTKLTKKFREAVVIKTVPMVKPGSNEVVVRNRFAGVNASDINKTAGLYDVSKKPPFDLGFESVGEVVAVGNDVINIKIGQSVCCLGFGCYSEYFVMDKASVMPVPCVNPDYVSLMISGLTADLALMECGRLQKGETVLITAAAGGTGQLAVQFAKLAGCHVIGTCSSDSKAVFLKSLGCDRAINYTSEDLGTVLKKEYPKGVDVVYECIGGETFNTCLQSIASKGRLIFIGYISTYTEKDYSNGPSMTYPQMMMVLTKSVCVNGFFLYSYCNKWTESFARQKDLLAHGSLKVNVDLGKDYEKGPFKGIEGIADAVDYLYTRKSQGKVIVEINDALPSSWSLQR